MKRVLMAAYCLVMGAALSAADSGNISLIEKYPTTLTQGDDDPYRARSWEFTASDIFRLSGFRLRTSNALDIVVGAADLGIGHCVDGAVWAVVIPSASGQLTSPVVAEPEEISHIWLRFHPKEIEHIFPPETVLTDGDQSKMTRMIVIAYSKFRNSWHAGMNAMIPEPKDITVDVDTRDGLRRFFAVNTEAQTAAYYSDFENRAVQEPPAITPELAASAFDQLWQAFDRDYAMFVLRPEVDWTQLREKYRPLALASQSTYEFAGFCAELLKPLRDLHVWLTLAGANVPVFDRPRPANANPTAYPALLGEVHDAGADIEWALTTNKIGFIVIYSWTDDNAPAVFDSVLDNMRDTRALIIDVRLNGGGSEPLAEQVAERFLDGSFTYAYSQYRNGPNHNDLGAQNPRTTGPGGPWRYDRPVVLLIGQRCMSTSESFVAMMTGAPQVVTLGDHTAGSSGNPEIIQLPLGVTVSVPRWIDYLPDGTPLDEKGVAPQLPFVGTPESFQGERDDLLSAALERLKQVPLPDKPIQGVALAALKGQWPGYIRSSAVAVTVSENYAYVAASSLQVIDIGNPSSPKLTGYYNGSFDDVAISGTYAYLVNRDGLLVIDISNPAKPQKLGGCATKPWDTLAVAVTGNYAYVAGSGGFKVFDVANPKQPVLIGTYDTSGYAYGIAVAGNHAYVADGDNGLVVVDVTNPKLPVLASSYHTSDQALGVAVAGHYAYLAERQAGLEVIDIADPVNPKQLGAYNTPGIATRLVVSGQVVYVADYRSLQVIDVGDPTAPRLLGSIDTNLMGDVKAVAVSGNYAYEADASGGLKVIAIANPAQPQQIGRCQTSGFSEGVVISGNYACVDDMSGGLQVIDISDADHPMPIAGFDFAGQKGVGGVATTGTFAITVDGGGLDVFDLASSGGPQWVGQITNLGSLTVAAAANYAYVIGRGISGDVFQVIDLKNTANPQRVGILNLPTSSPQYRIAVAGNCAYVGASLQGLQVIDISNPTKPRTLGTYNRGTNWLVFGVAATTNYACIATLTTLQIIEVSNPACPNWAGEYNPHQLVQGVALQGYMAYAVDDEALHILDISHSDRIKLIGRINGAGGYGVAVSRNRVCVAAGYLKVLERYPLPPRLDARLYLAGGDCRVSVWGEPGQALRLQRSLDLKNWQDWTAITADGNVQEQTDPGAASKPAQFYRAVVQ
jgi:hypothetical protein